MNTPELAMTRLVAAVDALPPDQREAYKARYVQDESAEFTCERLNISREQYEKLLKDARLALRRGLMSVPTAPAGN